LFSLSPEVESYPGTTLAIVDEPSSSDRRSTKNFIVATLDDLAWTVSTISSGSSAKRANPRGSAKDAGAGLPSATQGAQSFGRSMRAMFAHRAAGSEMKIATLNVNDVRKRLANFLGWLRVARPDVACLQELKAADSEFPIAAIKKAGYDAIWLGQNAWNGVAILGRDCEPVVTRTGLPSDPDDTQSRYIEAAVNGVLIATIYAPNGNPQPGPKFKYKLAWMKRLLAHAADLCALDAPAILAGDFNVVPTDNDIYPTKSYANNALVQPEPRALFRKLLDQGWVDAIRTIHPDAPMYTFWDYRRNRWERDAGLRIDHLLLNPQAAKRLVDAGVDREVRGIEGASDHAPAWIVLRDTPAAHRKSARQPQSRTRPGKRNEQQGAQASRRPLLVIDGDSFAHRSYHALPKTILRRGRKPAGAILGFANMLLRFYRNEQPRAVLVAWDTLDVPTYRHKNFPAYQSGRQFDEALLEQLDALPEFVAACGFQNAKAPGFEADDFLAAGAAAEEKRDGTVLVASGDRDTFQLASDRTVILYPLRAGEMARIGPAEVRARYGVDPAAVPDFIALRGDPSDKVPGAPGVGATGAATLLRKYGSLDALLDAGRFPAMAEQLRIFKSLATMNRKAPLPSLRSQKPTWHKAAALARKWELNQLADRLEALVAQEHRTTRRP
jgi:exodeoxyribonuclease III